MKRHCSNTQAPSDFKKAFDRQTVKGLEAHMVIVLRNTFHGRYRSSYTYAHIHNGWRVKSVGLLAPWIRLNILSILTQRRGTGGNPTINSSLVTTSRHRLSPGHMIFCLNETSILSTLTHKYLSICPVLYAQVEYLILPLRHWELSWRHTVVSYTAPSVARFLYPPLTFQSLRLWPDRLLWEARPIFAEFSLFGPYSWAASLPCLVPRCTLERQDQDLSFKHTSLWAGRTQSCAIDDQLC